MGYIWAEGTAVPFAFTNLNFSKIGYIGNEAVVFVLDNDTDFYRYNISTGVWTQLASPTYEGANTSHRALAFSPDWTKIAVISEVTQNYRGGKRIEIYNIAGNSWSASSQIPNMPDEGDFDRPYVVTGLVWQTENIIWAWGSEATAGVKNFGRFVRYTISGDNFDHFDNILNGTLTYASPHDIAFNAAKTILYAPIVGALSTNWYKYTLATDSYALGGELTAGRGFAACSDKEKLWYFRATTAQQGFIDTDDDLEYDDVFDENIDRSVGYGSRFGINEANDACIVWALADSPWIMFTLLGTPNVSTELCTDIVDTTATGNGTVSDLGDEPVTQHGHCWSENPLPTIADSKTENGAKASTGAFTSAITGLTPSTLYYVRAYATNSIGTAYGEQVECTTFATGAPVVTTQECTEIQSTTATGNGNLTSIGASAVVQHGHCWAADPNPTTADFKTQNGAAGVGVFTSAMTSLTPGATYYVRAYAVNTQGAAYGDNVVLVIPTGNIPTVTTQACSAIAPESATGHGNITSFGDDTPSQHGHCWSTSQYPTLADPHTNNWIPFAPGAFTSAITGLVPDTRYYIRAYATNAYGTAYGNQVSIFTYPGGAVINPANPVAVDWADDGVFVDISADVMEEYVEYGKDRELNEATPSLLSLTLDNFSHKYSPPNASSPYNTGANSVRAGHRITVAFGYPFDDFDDVDGVNIVNHAVPKDSQFAWTEESGTFSIYDGKLRETGGAGGIAVIDFGEAEAHVQVDFTKGANNDCIIVFRYSDTSNYLYVKTDGTNIEIRKVDGGADTQVATTALAWANGVTKSVKVILHGAYIYLVVEGSLVIKTSSTHNQTETEHGVGGPIISTNARYDDFGGIYSLFYGTIDRIIPYPHKERQTALIEASDDLKILERHILYRRAHSYTAYPGGMRAFIQEVYKNTANVSQLGEIMDIGETIASSPLKSWWGISGLRVCRNVEREENGFFYQDQDSFWNFEAKGHRAAAPHATPRCIFYQDYETNNLAFTGFKWASGEEDVFNMISVHVQKSQRDPLNLPTGGQEVWRCAEADVLDGGVTSQLEIPASSSVVIFFESKDFDCLVDLINPATASNVYRIEGKITDGPFLLGETVTGSVSGHTGKVVEQGGGYIILGDSSGAFNAADIWVGATSGATLAIGFRIKGTVTNGPFLWGEGITTNVSGDTGIVREVGQGFVVLESCSGVFLAGDTLTGSTSAATMNGTLTITVVGAKTAIPDYQANAAADGSGADKTGNLTVVLSYPVYNSYGKGGKLALTNDDASPIYVTRLLVRGDGYHLKDMGSVYVEDATSKATYGEHSYDVKAEILTSLAEAKVLADDVESKEDTPRSKVEMTITNANKEMLTKILSLKLSDRITGNYSDMGVDEDFFINKIVYQITQGGLVVDAVLKLEQVS